MLLWVVGAGGQLGEAVTRAARQDGASLFDAPPVDWSDPSRAHDSMRAGLSTFYELAAGDPWAIAWCAGSSVVASSRAQTDAELQTLKVFVEGLKEHLPIGQGVFFLASSAGGVYAGSQPAPFGVDSQPRPVSPYGSLKLEQEAFVTSKLSPLMPVVVGRLSNLYGPRTNPGKRQGLIPSLCRATIHRRPLNLYVSMDTIRDYLYSDDAGELVWSSVRQAHRRAEPGLRIEVMASGAAATVADVVATVQSVAHRRVPIALGTDSSAQHQAIDLRMTPSVRLADGRDLVTLATGVKRVLDAVASEVA